MSQYVGRTNRYFRNYDNKNEQRLLESLIVESTGIYGVPAVYVARTFVNFNQVYGADDQSVYQFNWPLAMYMKEPMGFTGDREFLSKFAGLEIRDQVTFVIPRYSFDQVITSDPNWPALPNGMPEPSNRPREGDLVYIPFEHLQKCFQIKYVNLTGMFFPLGKVYSWEVTCELFEYSSEIFNTGISGLDRIQIRGDLNIFDYQMITEGGSPIVFDGFGNNSWVADKYDTLYIDAAQDNVTINTEANTYVDWSDLDPFADAENQGGTI